MKGWGTGDGGRCDACALDFRGLANGFDPDLIKPDGIASLCFPLSFFCGEKGLKLARGAVVSTKREADGKRFGGLEVEVCLEGVEGGSLGCEVELEGAVAALESFL